MATITVNGPALGGALRAILVAEDIQPGDAPSYELCKLIYTRHVLGAKLAELPIKLAQSKPRVITIPDGPEDRVVKQFLDQWRKDGAEKHIFNLHRLKRVYGIASIAVLDGKDTDQPLDYEGLWKAEVSFNVLDPLNTAGSLTGDLDPNSPDFLKTNGIAVNGKAYHRSRCTIAMNEEPVYLEWTAASFGYVGRSVYQRTLYPLKSFIETMITDAMVARKAGVIVAALKQAGSIVTNAMQKLFGLKRDVVKEAVTDNVISIGIEERIESLNLQNVNGAMDASRKHILEDIAAGAGMPAILVNSETYAEGFGEGTEDAKAVADYIGREREDMQPSYAWMDQIIQYRAWNPEFYATIQADFPDEYGNVEYKEAFYRWRNSFTAKWPSFLMEPDSEKVRVDEVKLKAMIAVYQVIAPDADPSNKAKLAMWLQDNLNEMETMFSEPLELDFDALEAYVPPAAAEEEPKPGHPFAVQDADYGVRAFMRQKPVDPKHTAAIERLRAAARMPTVERVQ